MNNISVNNNIAFTSRKNPIPLREIREKGLTLYEVACPREVNRKFVGEIADFFNKNFIDKEVAAGENAEVQDLLTKLLRIFCIDKYKSHYKRLFRKKKKTPDFSVLLARDNDKKELQGVCIAYSLGTKIKRYIFIDSLAVNENFRKKGIAREFLDMLCESSKKEFKGFCVASREMAVGFYSKLGFRIKSQNQIEDEFVMSCLFKDFRGKK